jgi:hypothetical protein
MITGKRLLSKIEFLGTSKKNAIDPVGQKMQKI